MNKQTAVEWITKKIETQRENGEVDLRTVLHYCEQAKAMEREQITEAHLQGLYCDIKMRGEAQAEQYYNETYKKDKNDTSI